MKLARFKMEHLMMTLALV